MAHDSITLTGTYQLFDGTAARGIVEIIPSEKMVKDTTGNVVLSGRVKVELDTTGAFSVSLPDPRDTSNLNPAGFGYTVVAKLYHQHLAAVSFGGDQIAASAVAGVLDIEDVTSVDPSTFTAGATYVESGTLAPVATTGAYADLSGQPAIPSTAADVGAEPAGSVAALDAELAPVAKSGQAADLEGSDASFSQWIDDPASQTHASLSAAYGRKVSLVVAADGSGDYTTIADALAAVPAGGADVLVKRGTYTLANSEWIPAKTTLRGEGQEATIIRLANGANSNVLVVETGADDVTIRDLTVDGNRANQTANSNCIRTVAARTKVIDCHVKSANGYNIVAFPGAADFIVRNCVSEDSFSEGIEFQGCDGGSAIGNTVINPGKNGIYVYANTASNAANICRNITVTGNTVRGPAALAAGYSGIHVDDAATGVTVAGNVVVGGTGTGSNGIRIEGQGVKDVTVTGNSVRAATKSGILVKTATGVTVTGNVVSHCQRSGIEVQSATDWLVTDNVCRNNGQDATDGSFGNGITVYNNSGTVDRGRVAGNRCYDDQATKTQDYGLRFHNTIGSSVSVGPNILDGNLTSGMAVSTPGATGPSFIPWKMLSNIAVSSGGNSIAHGLPYVPQTIMVFMRGTGIVRRAGNPDATSVVVASDVATTTCDIYVG
jgi:parallel beta-helix repeat protein